MKSKSSKFKNVPSSEEIYAHIFGPTWRIRQYQAFVGHISKKNILFSGYVYQINTIYRYCFYLLLNHINNSSHQNAPREHRNQIAEKWHFLRISLTLCMFQQTVNVGNRLSCKVIVTSFTFLCICMMIASANKIYPHFAKLSSSWQFHWNWAKLALISTITTHPHPHHIDSATYPPHRLRNRPGKVPNQT